MAVANPGALRIPIVADDRGFISQMKAVRANLGTIAAPGQRVVTLMGDLGTRAGDTARRVGNILPALGALTSAASVAGLVRLAEAWGETGTALLNLSRNSGVVVSQLRAMEGATRLAGGSADTLDASINSITQTLSDARFGRNVAAAQTLRQALHLDPNTANAADVLNAASKALQSPGFRNDPQARNRLLDSLSIPREMQNALLRDWQALQRRAQQLAPFGQQQAEAADRLRASFDALKFSAQGLGEMVGSKLGPAIQPVIDGMTTWIAKNREWIGQGVGAVIKRITDAIKGVNWKEIQDQIGAIVKRVMGWATAAGSIADAVTRITQNAPKPGETVLGYGDRVLDIPVLPGTPVPGTQTGSVVRNGVLVPAPRNPGAPATPSRAAADDGLYQDVPSRPANPLFHRESYTPEARRESAEVRRNQVTGNDTLGKIQDTLQRQLDLSLLIGGSGGGGLLRRTSFTAGGGVGGALPPNDGRHLDPAALRDALMQSSGLSKVGASALTSAFSYESGGLQPGITRPGGKDFGLGQWTQERRAGLFALAQRMGLSPSDPQVQLAFIGQELREKYRHLLPALQGDDVAAANNAAHLYESGGAASLEHTRAGHNRLTGQILNLPGSGDLGGGPVAQRLGYHPAAYAPGGVGGELVITVRKDGSFHTDTRGLRGPTRVRHAMPGMPT